MQNFNRLKNRILINRVFELKMLIINSNVMKIKKRDTKFSQNRMRVLHFYKLIKFSIYIHKNECH